MLICIFSSSYEHTDILYYHRIYTLTVIYINNKNVILN